MTESNGLLTEFLPFIPPQLQGVRWQGHLMDGKMLLFDRDSGMNLLLEGEETARLRRVAPRTLLIAVTNVCNLKCGFCYRDLRSPSGWTYDTLMEFCQEAAEWGVLEVAFGGGEPTLFPHWAQFINELYASTSLAVNFTTNGMFLTDEFLTAIAGKYGNIRLSLYDTNDWQTTIPRLVAHRARFGVNWMVTPDELPHLEYKFLQLLGLGARDFLLLRYKGDDNTMHLSPAQLEQFSALVTKLHKTVEKVAEIKLDVCWGDALPQVPRLFTNEDCGAGDDFLSITSDKRIKPCSFHQHIIPVNTLQDVRAFWEQQRTDRTPAYLQGCGRLPYSGVPQGISTHEIIPLDSIFEQS